MKGKKSGDGFLIKVLIFGVLAFVVLLMVSHFVSKQVNNGSIEGATSAYIDSQGIEGSQAMLMLNSSKEASQQNQEDSVDYHTLTLQYSIDLSMFIQRVNTIHYEVVRSGNSVDILEFSYDELERIKEDMLEILGEMGNVNPPVNKIEDHQYLLENMAEAIVELDYYQDDVINGRISGPTQNTHFTSLKTIMSRMQSVR